MGVLKAEQPVKEQGTKHEEGRILDQMTDDKIGLDSMEKQR